MSSTRFVIRLFLINENLYTCILFKLPLLVKVGNDARLLLRKRARELRLKNNKLEVNKQWVKIMGIARCGLCY